MVVYNSVHIHKSITQPHIFSRLDVPNTEGHHLFDRVFKRIEDTGKTTFWYMYTLFTMCNVMLWSPYSFCSLGSISVFLSDFGDLAKLVPSYAFLELLIVRFVWSYPTFFFSYSFNNRNERKKRLA